VIRTFLTFTLLGALLFQVGCSQSQVTTTLDLVVTAADAAVSVLQSTGTLPPGTASLITGYLGQVTTGVEFATTELASTDSTAVKAAKITQEFAMIVVPNLPPGTGAAIVSVVASVAQAVANFLSTLQTVAMTSADKQVLPKIARHNAMVRAKLIIVHK